MAGWLSASGAAPRPAPRAPGAGPAFDQAQLFQRLVALHHLGQQLARCDAGLDLVAAGADAPRLPRPAEPLVQQLRARPARRPRPSRWPPSRGVVPASIDSSTDGAASGKRPVAASTTRRPPPARPRAPAGPATASSSQRDPLDVEDMGGDDNCRMSEHPLPDPRRRRRTAPGRLGRDPRRGPRRRELPARPADAGHRCTWSAAQARLAGYCSAKGRLLATFVVWRLAAEQHRAGLQRRPAAGHAEAPVDVRAARQVQAQRCQRRRGRCTGWPGRRRDALAAAARCRRGAGPAAATATAQLIRLPRCRRRVALSVAPARPRPRRCRRCTPTPGAGSKCAAACRASTAATAEQFVPQMLNLELLGGVNFKKGCYPGQEVVARSQYRGTLKRRTYLVDSAAPLAAGHGGLPQRRPGASRPAWWCWRIAARRAACGAGGTEDGRPAQTARCMPAAPTGRA